MSGENIDNKQMQDLSGDLQTKFEQLDIENKKQENQIKDLVKVNASWEKYVHDLKTDHEKQIKSIMQNLKEERELVGEYRQRHLQEKNPEDTIRSLQDQKDKAVQHAINQTEKVDDLKKKLKLEQTRVKELEQRGKDLDKVRYLETAVNNLRSENKKLKEQLAMHTGGLAPMDFEFVGGENHEDCKKKILESSTQIGVLQQQIAVFKEDFDNERNDREQAQAEVSSIEIQYKALLTQNQDLQRELYERQLEINALRETRDRQDSNVERLENTVRELRRELEQRQHQGHSGDKYNVHFHNSNPQGYEGASARLPSPTKNVGFLTEHQKQQFRRYWSTFTSNLSTDDVVIQLFSEGVLSMHQKQEIDAKATSIQKAEYVMGSVIMRGTQRDIKAFRNALINSNQGHLAELVPLSESLPARPTHHNEHYMTTFPEKAAVEIPKAMLPTWRCFQCTFENTPSNSVCAMCGHQQRETNMPPAFRGIDQCDRY